MASPFETRVLVTGASGGIGRHVVAELVERGYQVRALTSKEIRPKADGVEWLQLDFQKSLDCDAAVRDCTAVIHLAAIYAPDKMQRINVEATQALVQASERAGVKFFCYTSTISVYGSGLQRTITEESPVLTEDKDVKNEYWESGWLRNYGRTKLKGESIIAKSARNVEYVIVRPTKVGDIDHLVTINDWSRFKKSFVSHRHPHYIYVRDVADAILWFMERCLGRDRPVPGVSIYNLSDDECVNNTYAFFFERAHAISGSWPVIGLPWQLDWLYSFLKSRTFPLRHPLGRMFFSSAKLRAAGYTLRYGMSHAYRLTFDRLKGRRLER